MKINGYSNEYWGWGGEDDDLYKRSKSAGYGMHRPSPTVSRYRMIKHDRQGSADNARKKKLQHFDKHWDNDGLSNLHYTVLNEQTLTLYKNITVDIQYNNRLPDSMLYRRSLNDYEIEDYYYN